MKYKWDKKFFNWGMTAFLVLACAIIFYHSLSRFGMLVQLVRSFLKILMPVIYGLVIAYLLTPIMNFIETKLLFRLLNKCGVTISKKIARICRGLSIFISLTLTIIIIYGLLNMLIPQLLSSLSAFVGSAPSYLENFQNWVLGLLHDNPKFESYFESTTDYLVNYLNGLLPQVRNLITQLSSSLVDFFVVLKNVVIGAIISIYLMNSKELFTAQSKKAIYAILPAGRANSVIKSLRFIHQKFSGFIIGKIIDSLIIGVICYIVTSFMKIPYNVLISVIIGATNIIPFFGPYIGAIPSAFLILLVNPVQCLYFVIFVLVLQTFDGNVLGPRILSESTELSSFWIIFAILVMGGLFGIIGMFIGVPVFAVLYAAARTYMNKKLKLKKMSTQTKDYETLDYVDMDRESEHYGELISFEKNSKEKNEVLKKMHDNIENKIETIKMESRSAQNGSVEEKEQKDAKGETGEEKR